MQQQKQSQTLMKSNRQISSQSKNNLQGAKTLKPRDTQSIASLQNISKQNSIMNLSAIKSPKNEVKQQEGQQKNLLTKSMQSRQMSQVLGQHNSVQDPNPKLSKSQSRSKINEDLNESQLSSQASVQSELNEFNARSRNKILNFLIFLCESELFLEKLRQKACSFSQFEPYAVFQRFNRLNKRELEPVDISNFMLSLNQKISLPSIKNLMWFYDLDRSNSLSYLEFMAVIMTIEDDDLRTKISMRPTYKVTNEDFLPMHMEVAIGKLFYQLIQFLEKIQEFRSQLEADFNIAEHIEAFKYLDKEGKGEIEDQAIIEFLMEQSYNPSALLSKNILRNFKGPNADFIDFDEDNIIGYDEFGNPIYRKNMDAMKFVRFLVPNMSKDVLKHAFDIHQKTLVKIPIMEKYSYEIRKEWLDIFKKRVIPEKEIEYCKQDLAMQKDFSAEDMFNLINSDNNEYISIEEFVQSLHELNVQPFKDELYLFFRRHAANKQKGLREDEFILSILPNQHTYDKVAINRDKISKEGFVLKMKDLLKFELKIEDISLQLAKLTKFSYEDFFELLDRESRGYFSLTDLKQVFIDHKIDLTEKELSFLFKRLDCKVKDDQISYVEFINEVQPHLPKNLIARRFTKSQRQKQIQSMANLIDTELNLKSRVDVVSKSQSNAGFSIQSLPHINDA